MGLMDIVPAGVVTGDNLMKLMEYCRDNQVREPLNFSEIQEVSSKSRFITKSTTSQDRKKPG